MPKGSTNIHQVTFNRTMLELKLCYVLSTAIAANSFNRTMLELKFLKDIEAQEEKKRLLIVPCWN